MKKQKTLLILLVITITLFTAACSKTNENKKETSQQNNKQEIKKQKKEENNGITAIFFPQTEDGNVDHSKYIILNSDNTHTVQGKEDDTYWQGIGTYTINKNKLKIEKMGIIYNFVIKDNLLITDDTSKNICGPDHEYKYFIEGNFDERMK